MISANLVFEQVNRAFSHYCIHPLVGGDKRYIIGLYLALGEYHSNHNPVSSYVAASIAVNFIALGSKLKLFSVLQSVGNCIPNPYVTERSVPTEVGIFVLKVKYF